jgi:hypothetical protein
MVRAARATATVARAMVTVMRWWAAKRAIVKMARAIATAMRMVGDKEGNGKGGKGNGDGDEGGGRQRGQW